MGHGRGGSVSPPMGVWARVRSTFQDLTVARDTSLGACLPVYREGWRRLYSILKFNMLSAWPASHQGIHTPSGEWLVISHCANEEPSAKRVPCLSAWGSLQNQMTGGRRARTSLFSPCPALPHLCKPPDPVPEQACSPFPRRASAGAPGGRASHNSCRPGADLALYQGRRSRTIWPHSCPGGLTFPAPFQGNSTPRAVPPPTLATARLPSTETGEMAVCASEPVGAEVPAPEQPGNRAHGLPWPEGSGGQRVGEGGSPFPRHLVY